MHCVRKVANDLYWVGGNDHRPALFENIHPIPNGVSYNSYLLLDKKTVLFDTVDWDACRQLLENVEHVLNGRDSGYPVINHMEPDHGASIEEIPLRYPKVKIISTEKGFLPMRQFGFNVDGRTEEAKEGDTRCFGKHAVTFVEVPMVHWPETMVSSDVTNGVLFFTGTFGSSDALDGKLFNGEVDSDRDQPDDARRHYTNIVGKYEPHAQALLKKVGTIDVRVTCPLHGPVWRNDFGYLLDKYDKWSRYEPEETDVLITYASTYGNTESAARVLAAKSVEKGAKNVAVYDVSNTHVSYLINDAFKYSHIILVSVTYNLGVYPIMYDFFMHMKTLNMQKRTVGIIENRSWAPKSGSLMKDFLDNQVGQMSILNSEVSMVSALNDNNKSEMDNLIDSVIDSMEA